MAARCNEGQVNQAVEVEKENDDTKAQQEKNLEGILIGKLHMMGELQRDHGSVKSFLLPF